MKHFRDGYSGETPMASRLLVMPPLDAIDLLLKPREANSNFATIMYLFVNDLKLTRL